MSKSPITCHVLDASTGKPAEGVEICLQLLHNSRVNDGTGNFVSVAMGKTNSDGRCIDLLPPRGSTDAEEAKTDPEAGQTYKVILRTREYFERTGRKSFYPWVDISFTIENPSEHHHIPLLISPYSFTTYRGS
ncbi:hypothetical protein Agabi119p4_258 [Agaricus bisporus var. burnettii]|uniref:5-hydroxyisourate hydrolase n=1 Tax=Agaricus bisporus var. burnettii TaxID=192524 RepID=A0A8H7FAA2_AGABI|nr:hypothetical protein Agabi119p4_258 [Agaricus bisporus var. burnettii]